MPSAHIVVESNVSRSPRVMQMEGIFDVPISQKTRLEWDVNLPLDEKAWNIGLIVGPSGCGKSTLLRNLFGADLKDEFIWSPDKSILDDFPKSMSIKDITELLSSVGFSSPPSWVRPYRVLSNGEKFRVHIARLLAESPTLAVIDEFTSVVDRTVAQIGSSAVQRTIRRRNQKLIAATCHEDVEPWLNPDWIYRPASNTFQWRSLQRRPEIQLEIFRVHHSAWRLFRQHHYLDGNINRAAACFVAFWRNQPTAFSAWLNIVSGTVSGKREHRTVTLPDYQGVGIGNAISEWCAAHWRGLGYRAFSTTSHPSMIKHRCKSPLWRMKRKPSLGARAGKALREKAINKKVAVARLTAGFEYIGPANLTT